MHIELREWGGPSQVIRVHHEEIRRWVEDIAHHIRSSKPETPVSYQSGDSFVIGWYRKETDGIHILVCETKYEAAIYDVSSHSGDILVTFEDER